jgi:hypothetical protein
MKSTMRLVSLQLLQRQYRFKKVPFFHIKDSKLASIDHYARRFIAQDVLVSA